MDWKKNNIVRLILWTNGDQRNLKVDKQSSWKGYKSAWRNKHNVKIKLKMKIKDSHCSFVRWNGQKSYFDIRPYIGSRS